MNPYDPVAQYQMRYQNMQNELVNRDMDRKTSMSFGNGGFGSYVPNMQNNPTSQSLMDQSPALLPSHHNIMSSPMMNVQNPYMNMNAFGGM